MFVFVQCAYIRTTTNKLTTGVYVTYFPFNNKMNSIVNNHKSSTLNRITIYQHPILVNVIKIQFI